MEVDGEHVYEVTELGILVHNSAIDCEELIRLRNLKLGGEASAKDLTCLDELEKQIRSLKLKELIGGTNPPEWMLSPHVHHILYKKGVGPKQQQLVLEGMKLLWERGINPITDKGALVWAENMAGQHTIENLEKVVEALRKLDKEGGTQKQFLDLLKKLGREAAALGKE